MAKKAEVRTTHSDVAWYVATEVRCVSIAASVLINR